MAYKILYSILLLSIILGTALYLSRHLWLPHLPNHIQDILFSIPSTTAHYTRLRPSSFSSTLPHGTPDFRDDVEAGLHSNTFDLTSNITDDAEGRAGLDPEQSRDVKRIMKARGVGFDEARRYYMEQKLREGGVGKDGRPRDPKFVSFS